MTYYSIFNPNNYFYINSQVLFSRENPDSFEAMEVLKESLGIMAYDISQEYPTKEDVYGNASDIYFLLFELALTCSGDFLT